MLKQALISTLSIGLVPTTANMAFADDWLPLQQAPAALVRQFRNDIAYKLQPNSKNIIHPSLKDVQFREIQQPGQRSPLYLIDASPQARLVGSEQNLLCGNLACRLGGYTTQREGYRNVFTIYQHPSSRVEPLSRSAHGLPCLKFSGVPAVHRLDDNRTMTAVWCYDGQHYQMTGKATYQPN